MTAFEAYLFFHVASLAVGGGKTLVLAGYVKILLKNWLCVKFWRGMLSLGWALLRYDTILIASKSHISPPLKAIILLIRNSWNPVWLLLSQTEFKFLQHQLFGLTFLHNCSLHQLLVFCLEIENFFLEAFSVYQLFVFWAKVHKLCFKELIFFAFFSLDFLIIKIRFCCYLHLSLLNLKFLLIFLIPSLFLLLHYPYFLLHFLDPPQKFLIFFFQGLALIHEILFFINFNFLLQTTDFLLEFFDFLQMGRNRILVHRRFSLLFD